MTAKKVVKNEVIDSSLKAEPLKNVRKSAARIIINYVDSLVDLSDTISKEADIILEPVIGNIDPDEPIEETLPSNFPQLFKDLYIKLEIIEKNLKDIQKIISATELSY